MQEPIEDEPALPPQLNYLKWLTTALSVVMIVGFVVMITAFVIRLNRDPLPLPERITLPEGVSPVAFTQGTDWFAIVTSNDQILIYSRDTNALIQEITINH